MVSITAFQPTAFQNNAFQIADSVTPDTHDFALPDHIRKRLKYNPATQTYVLYKQAVEKLPPEKTAKIKRVIEAYVETPKEDIEEKDIRFDYLAINDMAFDMYMREIQMLKGELARIELQAIKIAKRKQEEEMIMLAIIGSIN